MSDDHANTGGSVLLLQVPRTNDKKALAAEQMFASLQGLLVQPAKGLFQGPIRERLSFEIAVINKRIGFYVWVPTYLKEYVEEQIYAQYPTVQISEVTDYVEGGKVFSTTLASDMYMTQSDVLPIKTFQSFEVDPLAAITATLAKFGEDEEAWLQMVVRPASEHWHQKNEKYLAKMKAGKSSFSGMMQVLWAPPEHKTEAAKLNEYQSIQAKAAETKGEKLAYETFLRIVYRGNGTDQQARLRLQSIAASYKQFNSTYLNGFAQGKIQGELVLNDYQERSFGAKSFVMNIEEVATLYHLPHTNVETPYILWASSQTAEPPANLPLVTGEPNPDISPVAVTNFRGHNIGFGLPRSDRGRHLYILGQTGVGKSGLLELLTISDVFSPFGFAIIDPHGDYAQNILKRIPPERQKDVVYFNAADTDFPVAFNPMEIYDEKLKTHTCSELIGVLKRLFESWGPRLEYILRYSLLALLDYPNATMLDITRILTDKKFRNKVLEYVKDPVVLNFWTVEFASWNDKFATEAVAPVLNKVGAFTANPLVRNIIGQPKSSFNIRQIMDERKILIVNLSRGLVGEDNAALLGALLVTKVQMAAMSRADQELGQRIPFYLYVDEFQNFATDSFATILSEARKYGLNLTVANQYVAQMMPTVKDAVFGNVGSIIAFRMSADDANTMQRYFEPKFTGYDLVHMHNRHFVISLTIEGEKSQAFSGITLELPALTNDNSVAIIQESRDTYGTPVAEVEATVGDQYSSAAPAPEIRQQYQTAPAKRKPKGPSPEEAQAAKAARMEEAKTAKSTASPASAATDKPAVAPRSEPAAEPLAVRARKALHIPLSLLTNAEEILAAAMRSEKQQSTSRPQDRSQTRTDRPDQPRTEHSKAPREPQVRSAKPSARPAREEDSRRREPAAPRPARQPQSAPPSTSAPQAFSDDSVVVFSRDSASTSPPTRGDAGLLDMQQQSTDRPRQSGTTDDSDPKRRRRRRRSK